MFVAGLEGKGAASQAAPSLRPSSQFPCTSCMSSLGLNVSSGLSKARQGYCGCNANLRIFGGLQLDEQLFSASLLAQIGAELAVVAAIALQSHSCISIATGRCRDQNTDERL